MEDFHQGALPNEQDATLVSGQGEAPIVRRRIDPCTGKMLMLHDASFWREHDAERRRRGQSVVEYSAAHGLALSTFRRWASRLRAQADVAGGAASGARAEGAAFLAVPIRRTASPVRSDTSVEIFFDTGISVKLAGDAAARVLETVMVRLSSTR